MRLIDADALWMDVIHSMDYCDDILEMIESRPTIQPEQRWIPCSERLPENDERVLATTAWGEVTIAERIYPPIDDTCWFIDDGNTNATIDDVVAWMPLSELYKDAQ